MKNEGSRIAAEIMHDIRMEKYYKRKAKKKCKDDCYSCNVKEICTENEEKKS